MVVPHTFLNFFLRWPLILSFTISFRFSYFSVKERIGDQYFVTVNKNMFLLILSLLFNESGATGLQRAGALIKEPLNSHKQINDTMLTGITDSLEENSYRLQVLRMHVGTAWELVFTDYEFTKQPSGIDLINHRRKIAVELKNGYRINSIVRCEDFRRLKEFKRQHPRYIVILGFINDKTTKGKYRVKSGVHVMSGRRFLQYIFKGDEGKIICYLRRAVRTMCC